MLLWNEWVHILLLLQTSPWASGHALSSSFVLHLLELSAASAADTPGNSLQPLHTLYCILRQRLGKRRKLYLRLQQRYKSPTQYDSHYTLFKTDYLQQIPKMSLDSHLMFIVWFYSLLQLGAGKTAQVAERLSSIAETLGLIPSLSIKQGLVVYACIPTLERRRQQDR